MAPTLAQFERQLTGGPLAPVYLIAGAEDLLRIEAADALRAAAKAAGFAEREVFDVEGSFDWNAVAGTFATMSLFASRRVVELRLPTTKPGKEGGKLIEDFCASPASDILLLIVGGEWSRKHEAGWSRAVERCGVLLPIWPIKPNECGAWIAGRLKSRGVSADKAAVSLLTERVEGNLLAAAQEIDKLALLVGKQHLDVAQLEALVADSARFDVFAMVEAAVAGDAARALRIVSGLRGEGEQVAGLLPWLSGQLQALARIAAVAESGGNVAAAMSTSGIWDARQPAFRRALSRINCAHAQRLAAECGRVERIAKGREFGEPWLALERLLTAVADPRAAHLLAA
ncbi:MAG: DNA polymerase III subunit delta [Pseudomarimonas sp.]